MNISASPSRRTRRENWPLRGKLTAIYCFYSHLYGKSFCPRLSEIVTRTIISPGLKLTCVCLSVILSRFLIIYSIESVLSYDSEFLAMGFFDIVLSFPNVS